MAHQQQVDPTTHDTRLGLIFRACPAAEERCAGHGQHGKTRDDNQRRHQSIRHIRRHPPCRQDEPRQHRSDDRQHRKPTRRSFQEEPGVQHHQQQGETPQRRRCSRSESEEKQQRQTDEQQRRGTADGLEGAAETAGEHRNTEVEESKNSVNGEGSQQGLLVQVTHRPDGLGNHRKKRRHEVQQSLAPGDGKPGDDRHQREERAEDQKRRAASRLDRDQCRKNKEQRRRGQNRALRRCLERSADTGCDHRHEQEEQNEEGHKNQDAGPRIIVGIRQPQGKNSQRRDGADLEHHLRPSPDRDRCQPGDNKEQKAEQKSVSRSECGDCGQVDGKEQGQHRCDHGRLREPPFKRSVVHPRENEPGKSEQRKDQEHPERNTDV